MIPLLLQLLGPPALADDVCRHANARRGMPPAQLEVGPGYSYRWDAYPLGSTFIGVDVPFTKALSVSGGAGMHTAGKRDVWLESFTSRRVLPAAELGIRLRHERLTSAFTPTVAVHAYGIAEFDVGLQAEAGLELWGDRAHSWGIRAAGGGALALGRPPAPAGSIRFLFRLGGGPY